MAMNCPRCGKPNDEDNLYCGRCGLEFAKVDHGGDAPQDEVACHRHKRELTRLRCGRCERPICHKCVVLGPAGPRCKDCARLKVPVTARAIAGEAKITARNIFRSGPWTIYLWLLMASLVFGVVRGCMFVCDRPGPDERHQRMGDEP
jgi:ribosomal protein S27AE